MYYELSKKDVSISNSIKVAEEVIKLSHDLPYNTAYQKTTLATAHFTLATLQNLSIQQVKLHVNASIVLLQSIKRPSKQQISQLANAYFKRAEIFER